MIKKAQAELVTGTWKGAGSGLCHQFRVEVPTDNDILLAVEEFENECAIRMDWQRELVSPRKQKDIDSEGIDEAVVVGVNGILIRREHHSGNFQAGRNVDGSWLCSRWRLRTVGDTACQQQPHC